MADARALTRRPPWPPEVFAPMTKKRYPEPSILSRSKKSRRPFRLRDHYAAAEPRDNSGPHPIDLLVDALPEIAARCRHLNKMVKMVQRTCPDQDAFIRLMDAKFDYTTRREQAFFNLGYQRGHFAGLVQSSAATGIADRVVRDFQHQLGLAVASAKLPKPKIAAALLDVARAAVLAVHAH